VGETPIEFGNVCIRKLDIGPKEKVEFFKAVRERATLSMFTREPGEAKYEIFWDLRNDMGISSSTTKVTRFFLFETGLTVREGGGKDEGDNGRENGGHICFFSRNGFG
jgi:hypothetical protein